jgi:hypothetical protein
VGRVEVVIVDNAADFGVVRVVDADKGVYGVRVRGESSV